MTRLLARWAYALVLRLLAPAYLLRLIWRSRAEPLAWSSRYMVRIEQK